MEYGAHPYSHNHPSGLMIMREIISAVTRIDAMTRIIWVEMKVGEGKAMRRMRDEEDEKSERARSELCVDVIAYRWYSSLQKDLLISFSGLGVD